MIPLKNLSNFWRTPEMPLINRVDNIDQKQPYKPENDV